MSGSSSLKGVDTRIIRSDSQGDVTGEHTLDSLFDSLDTSVSVLTSDLETEKTRATDSEDSINVDLTALSDLEASNNTAALLAISTEEDRALTAEGAIQTQVDNIISNVDIAAIDSLSEIVSSYTLADNQTSNLLGLLISRVLNIEGVLNTSLDANIGTMETVLTDAAV